jgi:Domain of unknown function (DUF4326)
MAKRFGHYKSVKLHRRWLDGNLGALSLERMGFCPKEIDALTRLKERVMRRLHELDGRQLQCWCALTAPCHVDKLAELAPIHAEYERVAA